MQYFGILNVIYVEGFIVLPSSCAHPSRAIESHMGQPDGEAVKNVQPSIYLFDGGYATFNSNGAVNGWHYYIQDYMGNNRMVVNKNGTVEQVTHYYPYGGVIGDISTLLSDVTKGNNENLQKFKLFHYIPREQARSEGPRSHQKEIVISWREDEPLGEG